jgi:uncharacterized protein (DUF1800 family)
MMRLHRLLAGAAFLGLLAACGGGDGGPPPNVGGTPPPVGGTPLPVVHATDIETKTEAADFLRQAGFGGADDEIDALNGGSAVTWIQQQLALSPRGYKANLASRVSDDQSKFPQVSQLFYETLLGTDAELRARMTFALSQLFVINGDQFFNEGRALAEWVDILDRNAFGNYRDLMGDVTRSPVMGKYLTYLNNQKGNPAKGREPDENYARELLQLFTIGLVELNMDGTARLGANGQPVDTYTNEDVVGLARVFTGYILAGTSPRRQDRYADAWERPMMMNDDAHSLQEKRFLGTVIAENTAGEASVEQALDAIFAHPNLAPFVSRQLIQRFTASDPDPAYVRRVATAFETGRCVADTGAAFGAGQRGDLSATLAAILLDPTRHDDERPARDGKVREPVLNFVHLARVYQEAAPDLVKTNWSMFADTSDVSNALSQSPLRSPSVFNFYRPGFVAAGTETGDLGLTAPELQIVNAGSAVGYMNFMFDFISRTNGTNTVIPDFTEEMALANDPDALLDRIDLSLTAGRMTDATRAAIKDAVDALPIRSNNDATDRRSRVRIAVMMTVVAPEFMTLN